MTDKVKSFNKGDRAVKGFRELKLQEEFKRWGHNLDFTGGTNET